jgi:hypothetical protein
VSDDLADVAERLRSLSETLADLAMDRLRRASESLHETGAPDPALVAEEKRITRARRAVDKAADLIARDA